MVTLRVVLEPSVLALSTDPGGFFFKRHVAAWLETRVGTAYRSVAEPRVVPLPGRAAVYLEAPDNVTPDKFPSLIENWSKLTPWVDVARITNVPTVADPDTDLEALKAKTLPGVFFGSVGDVLRAGAGAVEKVLTILAVGLAAAAVIYAATRAKGEKTWD